MLPKSVVEMRKCMRAKQSFAIAFSTQVHWPAPNVLHMLA